MQSQMGSRFIRLVGRTQSAAPADRMKILIATDAFPPVCGGSGWSTYELARGLRSRGHLVDIVQPRPQSSAVAQAITTTSYDGFDVTGFVFRASTLPFA